MSGIGNLWVLWYCENMIYCRKVVSAIVALPCCLWDRGGHRAGGSLQITKPEGEIVGTSPATLKAQLIGGEGFSHPPLSSPFQLQVPAKDVSVLALPHEKQMQK